MRFKESANQIMLFTGILVLAIIFILLAVFKIVNKHHLQNKDTAKKTDHSSNLKDSVSGEKCGTATIII